MCASLSRCKAPVDTLLDAVRVLQVNSVDSVGGAAKVARKLFERTVHGVTNHGWRSESSVRPTRTSSRSRMHLRREVGDGFGGVFTIAFDPIQVGEPPDWLTPRL